MSTLRQIRRLPNMIDADASQIARVQSAATLCTSILAMRGYRRIDTPVIEETELFLRKSGGELSSRLYDFEEPGGFRTSLRPEFTSPVIRYAIENGEAATSICRYQYFGPVFRYATPEHPDGSKTRQFNQLGAELIGAPASRADGEVMSMATEGLNALNVPSATIALGHVGLLRQLLKKFQLSERSSQFLLANAGPIADKQLDTVRASAGKLGFLDNDKRLKIDTAGDLENIAQVLDRSLAPLGANAGSRLRSEVIARLARKQTYADDPGKFESALSMLSELMSISGEAGKALDDGRKLAVAANLDEKCFMLLEQVVEAAVDQGVDPLAINIRYGLARGVAYYTGMVFDILPSRDAGDSLAADSLGGGGRYDGLTRALGLNADVPALGFAYNLDAVVNLMPADDSGAIDSGPVLVRPADDQSWQAAAKAAASLREQGRAAVLDTNVDSSSGDFSETITVDSSGTQTRSGSGAGR